MHLEINDLTFTYPATPEPVLESVTITAGSGWTAIAGANGAGKSTLLMLACGLLRPDSGSARRLVHRRRSEIDSKKKDLSKRGLRWADHDAKSRIDSLRVGGKGLLPVTKRGGQNRLPARRG